MSTSVPYQFTTTASTNLQPVRAGQAANLKAVVAVNTAAYNLFLKFYNTGASNAPPVVGTTIPFLTVQINTQGASGGGLQMNLDNGVVTQGQLWVAVTQGASAASTTATAAGDGIVTLLLE